MQTGLNKLKSFINSEDCHIDQYAVSVIEQKILELLEKEKQQIVDAFTAGQIDIANTLYEEYKARGFTGDLSIPENDKEDGEQYYLENFKND